MQTELPVRRRRRFSIEFKATLVAQCQPGVSVSAVALENGINANQLRRWIREQAANLPVVSPKLTLVPIEVSAPVAGQSIEVNIQKRDAQVNIRWPPSVTGLFIPDNDSNCCTADVVSSESNLIMHKTAQFPLTVERRVSNLRLQIAGFGSCRKRPAESH